MHNIRNEPCRCGSGKKYKHCHGRNSDELSVLPGRSASALRLSDRGAAAPRKKRRQCEGCHACCRGTLQINEAELVLPTGETCPHLCPQGCARWGTPAIPPICRRYLCNYLVEPGDLTRDDAPDRVGAIFQRKSAERTLLAECRPNGLLRILQSPTWRPLIRTELTGGACLLACFWGDTHSTETIRVRWTGERLGCELPSCDADGAPVLDDVQPVHAQRLYTALFVPGQNFAFDARALIRHLGDREWAVLSSSRRAQDDGSQLCFRVSRRQVELLKGVLELLCPPASSARAARSSQPAAADLH